MAAANSFEELRAEEEKATERMEQRWCGQKGTMSSNPYDLFSDDRFQERLRQRLEEGWSFEKISPMSTDEIFRRLNRLGIDITPEAYQEAAQRYESAQDLAKEWSARYTLRPQGRYDEDFLWMAAIILWPRLVPDRISFEQIDDEMQRGYGLVMEGRLAEGCDAWRQTWEWLKDKVTPERNTLAALDDAFCGTQSVFNWCQDLEEELWNAGLDNPSYLQFRIQYCDEFLETFGDIGWGMRGNFLRAKAEALWRLGDRQGAEARYTALIDENPDWAWGYIGWSDHYWLFADGPKEYSKAEAILRRALGRPNLEDREVVRDRLKSLRAERTKARGSPSRQPMGGKRGKRRRR